MDRSQKWEWLWRDVIPPFADRVRAVLGDPVLVTVDTGSLESLQDPQERVPALLADVGEALRLAVSAEVEGAEPSRAERKHSSSPAEVRRAFLNEQIKSIEVRVAPRPSDSVLRLEDGVLEVSIPTVLSVSGSGAQELARWFQSFLDPEVLALLRKLQREDFPKAQAHLQRQLGKLIRESPLGKESRLTMEGILASDGVTLKWDWPSFTALEDPREKMAALRRVQTGHSTHNYQFGDLFGGFFRALDETSRKYPGFLWRFLRNVRSIRFEQSERVHVELIAEGSTLVVREGRHGLPGWEELLESLGPSVCAMWPDSVTDGLAGKNFVEVGRRQLEQALGKSVDLAVDPALLQTEEARRFLAGEVLLMLVGTIRLLADRPDHTGLLRQDLEAVRVELGEAGAKSSCTFRDGVLTLTCGSRRDGYAFLSPGELIKSIDDGLSLGLRARITELERERRDHWQTRLEEAFGREVRLDVDWDGFLAQASVGGNRLSPFEVVSSGVEPLLSSLLGCMERDSHFEKRAREMVNAILVTSAAASSRKGVSMRGDCLVSRCFHDVRLSGYPSTKDIERSLHRLLARREGVQRAHKRKDLPRCIRAILTVEAPYKEVCEVTSWDLEVAPELRPLAGEEEAVEARVSYEYHRGSEAGTFTDLQLYRWFPDGKLHRVFSRTIKRICQFDGGWYELDGQVRTTGDGGWGGGHLSVSRIAVSLRESVSWKDEAGGCKSEEEYVWSNDQYVDQWLLSRCRFSRNQLLDVIGLPRPLHSILGHELAVRAFDHGIAATVDLFGTRALFLLRDEGSNLKRVGSGVVASPTLTSDRPSRYAGGAGIPRLGQPYLYGEDPSLDLGDIGPAVPLSCRYIDGRVQGRVVQLYRCKDGHLEEIFSYNLEHRWDDGRYQATLIPTRSRQEGYPHLEVRGTLTRYPGRGTRPSETSFRRVFRWNGQRYVPRRSRLRQVLSGGSTWGEFSREEVLRCIYGVHLAAMSDLDSPGSVTARRLGERLAVLVVPERQLFLLEERNEELNVIAEVTLPEIRDLDDDYAGSATIRFTKNLWRIAGSEEAIGVECNLNLSHDLAATPLQGRARWLFLLLHRPLERSLDLVLQAPLGRRLYPASGLPLFSFLGGGDRDRAKNWSARLKPASKPSDGGHYVFRLATRGGGEDRVFLWSGFRYVDSGSIARLGDDLAEELQRLGLWQDEAARVPRELEATTAEDFPAWIQFSLLPSLAGVQDALCLPEVQGISGIADERLTGHARGLLLQLLGKLEAEIHPSRMRRAPAVWDWLDSGKGGRPRTLLDCVEKRDQI